jgi:EmrB/QacA subfamily drug resistance transporter
VSQPHTAPDPRRWYALALLAAAQFVVVLDVAIVNVALPSIKDALGFSQESLQWVLNAYTLTFGGLMLLGGRLADVLGRRRLFMIGMLLFAGASLAAGLAGSEAALITARAVQGVGAAIISPAALSILSNTFAEGKERNTALGIWGAVAGIGGAAGVFLGGLLTDGVGWEWIFFINVPVGLLALALAPRLLAESRAEGATRSFDVAGAVTVTGGLTALVYGLVKSNDYGWLSAQTLGVLAAAAALLVAFVAIERRATAPLVPLGMFRNRNVAGANVVGLLLGASIFSMFYFLSLYMQQVLGYSALRSGVAYLLVAVVIIISSGIAQALVTRFGVRNILAIGMTLLTAGLVTFTWVAVNGSYTANLVPGFILAGVGLGFAFVPVSIAALQGVRGERAGTASGLINTSQQIGGALGVAVLATVANSVTGDALTPSSLTDGFQAAFAVGAGMALVGIVAALLIIPRVRARREQEAPLGEPAVAAD